MKKKLIVPFTSTLDVIDDKNITVLVVATKPVAAFPDAFFTNCIYVVINKYLHLVNTNAFDIFRVDVVFEPRVEVVKCSLWYP